MKIGHLYTTTLLLRFVIALLCLAGTVQTGYSQQKVCPGQAYWYTGQPNVNTTYWIEFFVTNGVIVEDNYHGTNISNPTYASFTDNCGNYWSCGYPQIKVRWDNNGQAGSVQTRFHYSFVTWPFYFSYDDNLTVYIGTPAPTTIWIDTPNPDGTIPCSRNSFVAYTPDLSAWNAQYSWSNISNTQLVSNGGTNAVFNMNSGTSGGSINLQVTNSQCPTVSHTLSKSFSRSPANPTIFGLSLVQPGATEIYQVDGGSFQSYYWSVPSDWQLISEYNGQASIKAGNMPNMDGDIYFTYTDACGYSGQASKYVNTGYSGGRVAVQTPTAETIDIHVSPNPVENQLTVTIPGKGLAKITLLNTQGREYISKEVATGEWTYNMHTLPAGLYLVKVKANDKLYLKKVIKSN